MPKPKKPRPARTNVVEMEPEAAGSVAVEENPLETPFDSSEDKPAAAAPPLYVHPRRKPLSFFERVGAIPQADWGTRAFIYVYCLEPICNLKMGGENKYLVKLQAPIADEDPLMIDYGSGKYRLQLVHRKPAADKSDAIDTKEIEIYNPKYPPKIPRSVWMNDPRNERWAALLPPEVPVQPPTPLGSVTDAFKAFTDMRKDLREELTPAPSTPAAGPSPESALKGTLDLVNTVMAMKADNPMNEVFRDELKSLREELREERAENRRLMAERSKPATEEKRFGLKEAIADLKDVLPTIKEILPEVTATARSGRTNWLDLAKDIAPSAFEWIGKGIIAYASRMPMPAAPGLAGAPPAQLPAGNNGTTPPAGPPQQTPPANVPKFFQFLAQPLAFDGFRRYFEMFKKGEASGSDFAQWVFDGTGPEPFKEARALGSANIMQMLRGSPAWILFQSDEAKLVEFVDSALSWSPPEPPDTDGEDESDEEESVDLTRKGV